MLMTTLAWWGRLSSTEEVVRNAMKKLTQGMADHNKAMAAAKTEEAKVKIEKRKGRKGLGRTRTRTRKRKGFPLSSNG
ncbi:hypothetical protein BHE74_00038574 [Ensete ventricosum]|nr:hypothetical protein BHE74_00038574 [Ensete ventricosum]